MSLSARLLVALAAPIKHLDARSRFLERKLSLSLTDDDITLVRCSLGKAPLGAYYHWYLEKLLVARAIRAMNRHHAQTFIQSLDRTDYTPLQAIVDSATGVLVAIPHHAHYILSITALAAKLGQHRPVNVFYADPATNHKNAVFDHLHKLLFSNPTCGVNIIHNNRQGLAKAIKGLKSGQVVIIMPDAYQDEAETLMIPFCGLLMGAMMGIATLARKTGSWILPVLSRSHGGFAFKTEFGARIDYPSQHHGTNHAQTLIQEYSVMRRIFWQFEATMQDELHRWQHVRSHLAKGIDATLAERETLPSILDSLESSPVARKPDLVLDLR